MLLHFRYKASTMTEVVAHKTVLSDSAFRTRPSFNAYVRTDANALGNAVMQIEAARRKRHMKVPRTVGRQDVDSFRNVTNPTDPAFVKYNDEGDHRVNAPFRSFDNIIDPVAGFVSVGGDQDRSTGHNRIRSMVQLNHTPNTRTPQELHSDRLGLPGAPPETRRMVESAPGAPYSWNSRAMLDVVKRSQLGGKYVYQFYTQSQHG